jgi:alkylated DNA repair protein (DNA oxidative demethylase)
MSLPFNDVEFSELMPGVCVLRNFATIATDELITAIQVVSETSPFRRVVTPNGKAMSVEMTNCGTRGWVSDHKGYRYESLDPATGKCWPSMPSIFRKIAESAATLAGYVSFNPDVCLVNQYQPGTSMGMHQDRDERDFSQPIVSVSLGLPIVFKMGGSERGGKTARTNLHHGDVVVFGGPARLAFHGVGKLRDGIHPVTGRVRFNLTFRMT